MSREIVFKGNSRMVIDISPMTLNGPVVNSLIGTEHLRDLEWEAAFARHVARLNEGKQRPALVADAVAWKGERPKLVVGPQVGKYLNPIVMSDEVEVSSDNPEVWAQVMVDAWERMHWWKSRPYDVRLWRRKGDA